jgi:probable HAF family extracellular repeat protein
MCYTQSRFKALLSACVLSLIATAGWSQSLTWLGVLPNGYGSYANAVSADGAVVVGEVFTVSVQWRAFRWTASGGMQGLGTLGGDESEAWGVSADGAVVVGWAQNAAGQRRAFRWTASGGMQDLGTLGGDWSVAYGVSADGTVVVGAARNAAGQWRAFRWTASGGMQDLGTLGGDWSVAYAVSADGTVVVGRARDAAGKYRAFRWTASGMEDLNRTYASLLTNGSVLREARAISPDGRYIVGWGRNATELRTERTEAFLLNTGFPRRGDVDRNGCVDDADLLQVLFAFGGRGYRNEDLNWDGTVDDADLLEVLFHFGSGC